MLTPTTEKGQASNATHSTLHPAASSSSTAAHLPAVFLTTQPISATQPDSPPSSSTLPEVAAAPMPAAVLASSGIGVGNPISLSDPFNLQAAMLSFPEPNESTIFAAQRFCGARISGTPTRFLIDGQTLHDAFEGVIPGALIGTIYGLMHYVNLRQGASTIDTVRIDPAYEVRISPRQAMHMASTIIAVRQFASFAGGVIQRGLVSELGANRWVARNLMSVYPTPTHSLALLLGHRPTAPVSAPSPTEAAVAEYTRAHTHMQGTRLQRSEHLGTVINIAAGVLGIISQIDNLSFRYCYRTSAGSAMLGEREIAQTISSLIHDDAAATTEGEQAEGASAARAGSVIEDHAALPTPPPRRGITGHIWNAVRASAMRVSTFIAPRDDDHDAANSGSMKDERAVEDAHEVHVGGISASRQRPQTALSNSTPSAFDEAISDLDESDDGCDGSGGGGPEYRIGSRWGGQSVPAAASSASATLAASAPAAADVVAVSASEPPIASSASPSCATSAPAAPVAEHVVAVSATDPTMSTTAHEVSTARTQDGQSQEETDHDEAEVVETADSDAKGTTGGSQTPDEASQSSTCSTVHRPSDAAAADVVAASTTEPTMTTTAGVSKARSEDGQSQQEETDHDEAEVVETAASDAEGTTGGSQPSATSSASSTPADQSKSAKDDLDGASQSLTFSTVHRPSDANLEIGALNQDTSGSSAFTEMIESISLLISSIQSASVRASFEERFKTLIEWLQEQHHQLEGPHLVATDLKTYDGNFSTSNTDPLNKTDYTAKSSSDYSFTPLEELSASDIRFAPPIPEVPIMVAGSTSTWH